MWRAQLLRGVWINGLSSSVAHWMKTSERFSSFHDAWNSLAQNVFCIGWHIKGGPLGSRAVHPALENIQTTTYTTKIAVSWVPLKGFFNAAPPRYFPTGADCDPPGGHFPLPWNVCRRATGINGVWENATVSVSSQFLGQRSSIGGNLTKEPWSGIHSRTVALAINWK